MGFKGPSWETAIHSLSILCSLLSLYSFILGAGSPGAFPFNRLLYLPALPWEDPKRTRAGSSHPA